ncbi:Baculoviral IAP repeat-containing protein 7 [Oopsacas minuta]|uniref:Baculoviral IAP repeat-containing protein 7 n=1 Tax=Oopsacas minuta TaxID=111878 RepID=A0AAV7KGW3_9METZ|nr:Baculoviral IAP repeat-containing protein 7 [Oopsacas minuta]
MKNGLEIGERSAKDINNEKIRNKCKEKLQRKECTSLEYIKEISNTIGNPKFWTYSGSTELEESIDETSDSSSDEESMVKNPCIICLNSRDLTFVFIPCGHANVCGNCELNFTLGDRCPVCRSIIMNKMQIFQ